MNLEKNTKLVPGFIRLDQPLMIFRLEQNYSRPGVGKDEKNQIVY